MKIFTSYFYQVRFFKYYMIPLSTALGDPLWYHNSSNDNNVVFYDNNSVVNGLRLLPLVPNKTCSNLCRGMENCSTGNPDECAFLKNYYEQLKNINFQEFMKNLESHINKVCDMCYINREPIVVILVHEAATNPCSERVVIQRWFKDNGLPITELNPKEY